MNKELSNIIEHHAKISAFKIFERIALICLCASIISIIVGIIIMILFFINAPNILDIFFTIWAVIFGVFTGVGIVTILIAMHLYVKAGGELI